MGCASGMQNNSRGCYGDCYAAKSAKLYGHDFSKTVLRHFENNSHRQQVLRDIGKAKLPFIRIGCSGDPSEDWDHAIEIMRLIAGCNKQIIIITKHWTSLTDIHLEYLSTANVVFNTSVSALDEQGQRENAVRQYNRIRPFCKSILRIVSCDFNLDNETGKEMAEIQDQLFKNEATLDTVFRPSRTNPLVRDGVINTTMGKFIGKTQLMSKTNRKTFLGKCGNCHEMCGLNTKNGSHIYTNTLVKQLALFQVKRS